MSLTPEQARAVSADTSVAVLAGAGTGKTHMLTERYLHHLNQGHSPLEIVAVTFTERAAAELRARVRRAVLAASALGNKTLGSDALVELEAAQISTIHALAARICRDHSVAAGVPADFAVLDDLERPIWLADQLEQALRALPDTLFDFMTYTQVQTAMNILLNEPLASFAAFERGSERWPELVDAARLDAARRLVSSSAWQDATTVLRTYEGSSEDLIEQARQHALAGHEALTHGYLADAFEMFGRISRRGGSAKRWPQGGFEAVKTALKVIKDKVDETQKEGLVSLELTDVDQRLASLLPILEKAFRAVHGQLTLAKHQARVLDFVDLEHHALKALQDASVREHYQLRWRAFLIDEFQDTSPVQVDLLRLLTEGVNVTVVGDEKQSIYGFRGAGSQVFQAFREQLRLKGAQQVELVTSFRTHTELMSGFNVVFAPVLGNVHQELQAWRLQPPHPGPHLTLHAVDAPKGVNKPERRATEARFVAQTIREWIEKRVLVHDSGRGAERPLRWGDVAVLTRTWEPLNIYSEVFTTLDVPVVHSGGGNLLETREAKDGMLVLRFLADPHDNLALAALLRSPFFAVDDVTLYYFAQGLDKHKPWWDNLERHEDEVLGRAARVLRKLLSNRRHASPSRLLQEVDYHTGYSAVIANLPGSERREADWNGFRAFVRQLESGLADVFVVARRLRRLVVSETDVPQPTLAANDAVTLMTVHRAKGLEWPVVVLADMDYRGQTTVSDTLVDKALGVALKVEDDEGEIHVPALYKILKSQLTERENDEAKRVLYVGLTRARDRVLMTATQAKGGGLELLAPGLEALDLSCEVIDYDADQDRRPDLRNLKASPAHDVVAADLWAKSPSALGRYARYIKVKGETGKAPPSAEEMWDEVLALVGEMDASWLPHVAALRRAEIPAPHPDSVFRELTAEGTVTVHPAICMWSTADITIALVGNDVPALPFDQLLVPCFHLGLPETTVTKVQSALVALRTGMV